jgi:hypothetical protein
MSDPRLKQIEWANGEAIAVGLECLIELTLRHQNFADPFVRNRQIATAYCCGPPWPPYNHKTTRSRSRL